MTLLSYYSKSPPGLKISVIVDSIAGKVHMLRRLQRLSANYHLAISTGSNRVGRGIFRVHVDGWDEGTKSFMVLLAYTGISM